jgi:outer membrane protein OmpA-like peptidoglycan-associated protein
MRLTHVRYGALLLILLVAGIATPSVATADDDIKGVITGRGSDGTVTLRTDDEMDMILVMTEASKVRQVDGIRQVRHGARTLIPGLRVHASGYREGRDRFIVTKVTFERSDLKMALAIKGGVDPTDARSLENQRRIEENERTIARQEQTLAQQAAAIATNRDAITANEQKVVATTGVLDTRIRNLDNYTPVSSVTVYFKNGRADVSPNDRTQLQQLAAQARGVRGYVVQVQGYASDVGSSSFNQRLSLQRAQAVTAALQQGGVPPTNIVVPAAMGVSQQVASNKTAKGQAENRRTVVTLLQSKGIGDH